MSKGAFQSRIVGEGYEQPDQLLANPMNWRKHPKAQQDALEGMLRTVGWVQRVIVNRRTGHIVDGHLRVEVALRRDEPQVPVLYVDLTADEERVVLAAIDPIGGLAETDQDMLDELLSGLETGDKDLDEFLQSLRSDDAEIVEGLTDEDAVPEPPVEPVTKPGDVWMLGKHRLMCGDSTSIDAVERLMDGAKADMVFTDPPYGVEYQSNMRTKSDKFAVLANDDQFLDIAPIVEMFSTGWVFVWTSWKVQTKWIEMLGGFGYPTNIVIWHKPGGGIGDLKRTFSSDYEVALVWHRGAELCGKRIGSVWTINKDAATTYVHPTQKPVALATEALDKTTSKGASVLDLFGGSGSTLIACEKNGRVARLMELDPKYCDVIIKRWQEFTGKQATLEATGATFDEISNSASAAVIEIE